jgi:hypothetical protein
LQIRDAVKQQIKQKLDDGNRMIAEISSSQTQKPSTLKRRPALEVDPEGIIALYVKVS